MRISVIIPTYNRAEILSKTLRAYSEQTEDGPIFEALVIDDGSKDHTASVVRNWSSHSTLPVRYLWQENRGLAAARNHAIREAKGELLLFGDDDIIPSPKMVAEHLAWHREHPEKDVGVLGLVGWATEVNASPFMKWSGLYGPQFNFGYFKPGMQLDFRHTYFCNTSVKASFLAQHGVFSEEFRQYGWEDLELGYRLYLCHGAFAFPICGGQDLAARWAGGDQLQRSISGARVVPAAHESTPRHHGESNRIHAGVRYAAVRLMHKILCTRRIANSTTCSQGY
jgi:glycosyltransferase involved in cell wall biosynthesis